MGRPSDKSDCDEIGHRVHKYNMACSRRLLEALIAHHAEPGSIELPPLEDESEEPTEIPRNIEPDYWHTMWFGDLVTAQGPSNGYPPSISFIQETVARSFGLTKLDLISRRRTQNVVLPRQMAMYLAKTMTTRSYPEIGRRFGGRDHTTAIHSFQKINARCVSDPEFAGRIKALRAEISA